MKWGILFLGVGVASCTGGSGNGGMDPTAEYMFSENGTVYVNGDAVQPSGGDINISINLTNTNTNDVDLTDGAETLTQTSTSESKASASDNDNVTCSDNGTDNCSAGIRWEWWRGQLIRN